MFIFLKLTNYTIYNYTTDRIRQAKDCNYTTDTIRQAKDCLTHINVTNKQCHLNNSVVSIRNNYSNNNSEIHSNITSPKLNLAGRRMLIYTTLSFEKNLSLSELCVGKNCVVTAALELAGNYVNILPTWHITTWHVTYMTRHVDRMPAE